MIIYVILNIICEAINLFISLYKLLEIKSDHVKSTKVISYRPIHIGKLQYAKILIYISAHNNITLTNIAS